MAIGLVPSIGRMPPGGATSRELDAVWIATRPCFGDHLDIIGAAPTHPGIGHRNERNAVRGGLLDRRLAPRERAPACRHCFRHRRQARTRSPATPSWAGAAAEVFALRHVEDLGQAGIFIAAQRRIDDVIGDDACLIVVISDAASAPPPDRVLLQHLGAGDRES